jgi:hypothetical protein
MQVGPTIKPVSRNNGKGVITGHPPHGWGGDRCVCQPGEHLQGTVRLPLFFVTSLPYIDQTDHCVIFAILLACFPKMKVDLSNHQSCLSVPR